MDTLESKFHRAAYWLAVLVPVGGAILFGILFLIVAIPRLRYPFELEWIEGAYLDQARWLAHGKALYAPPSIDFIPTNKTPLFFWVSSRLLRMLGDGFLAPRLVSFSSTIGVSFLLGRIIYEKTGKMQASLVAGGLYLSAFRFTGAWMDIGKTDSLFIFFLLLGFYWQSRYAKTSFWFLAPVTFVLAYYTKQMALPVLLVMAFSFSLWGCSQFLNSILAGRWMNNPPAAFSRRYVLIFGGLQDSVHQPTERRRLAGCVTILREWVLTFGLGTGIFLWLNWRSDGWFSFYTFSTTIRHDIVNDKVWLFWGKILPVLWPSLVLSVGFGIWILYSGLHKEEHVFSRYAASLVFALGLLAASWSVFLKVWTYDNDLLPVVLGCALLGGMVYGGMLQAAERRKSALNTMGLLGVTLLLSVQFFFLRYDAASQIPSEHDARLGWQFVSWIAEQDGDVWVFNHGFYSALAGKRTFLHSAPLGDVAGVSARYALPPDVAWRKQQVMQVVQDAVREQRFSWIVVDKSPDNWLPYYVPAKRFFEGVDGFYPVTGAPTRPRYGLVRNPVVRGGVYPLTSALFAAFAERGWRSEDRSLLMDASDAALRLALETGRQYTLVLAIEPFCVRNQPAFSRIDILWNEHLLGKKTISSCDAFVDEIALASQQVSGKLDTLTVRAGGLVAADESLPWVLALTKLEIR